MLISGGSTSVTTYFVLRKTSDGTAATGLTITGIDLQYTRSGVAPVTKVDATALAATDSSWDDNKAIEIDATSSPGLYRVDWPDAAFAAGVREVILSVKVATAFTEHLRCEIDGEVNTVEIGGTDVVLSSGLLDVNIAATDDIDLSATQKASVNTEVDTALGTTTYVEPTGVPPSTDSLSDKIGFMYMALRNKLTVTSTKKQFFDDAGNAEWEKDLSDDATTYTETEGNAP